MRDPKRIDLILAELAKLWKQHPDMRLGQLLENYVFPSMLVTGKGEIFFRTMPYIWSQEDDETLNKIKLKVKG